jgi:hypothetical protein
MTNFRKEGRGLLEKDMGMRTMATSSSLVIFVVSVVTNPSVSVAWNTNGRSDGSCQRGDVVASVSLGGIRARHRAPRDGAHENISPPPGPPCDLGTDIERLRPMERVTVYMKPVFQVGRNRIKSFSFKFCAMVISVAYAAPVGQFRGWDMNLDSAQPP